MTSRAATVSAAISVMAGIALTVAATLTEPFPREQATTGWLVENLESAFRPISEVLDGTITDLSATAVYVLVIPAVYFCWGRWTTLAFLAIGVAAALARVSAVVSRPRPNEQIEWSETTLGDGGFSSRHVLYMVLVAGVMASCRWARPDQLGQGGARCT